jgi:hypothetical protein
MIKLKSILNEIFEKPKLNEIQSGTYEYTAEFDGQEILAFSRETDLIEVTVDIEYSIIPGSPGTRDEPPEGSSVEILEYKITGIRIYNKDGEEKEIDVRFLHPIQEKIIERLVHNHIGENSRRIEDSIYDLRSGGND